MAPPSRATVELIDQPGDNESTDEADADSTHDCSAEDSGSEDAPGDDVGTDGPAGASGDTPIDDTQTGETAPSAVRRVVAGISWSRVLAYGVLPGIAVLLAAAAGWLKWQDSSVRSAGIAQTQAVQAATDSTVALLSYRPDTVEKDLGAARDRLTGTFRDAYTSLTRDIVIPGAKQKQISAVATVPAVAAVSATGNHAVVLLFVNQTVVVGNDAPTDTASSVRVTLDKIGDRWFISGFDPI